jgi:hypothetical protein
MSANHHVIRATVIGDITEERRRQIEVEGWTPEHDDEHSPRKGRGEVGPLVEAAACYLFGSTGTLDLSWPWSRDWWKPKGRRRDLVRAAALIIAEIERIDRAHTEGGGEP